MTCLFCGAHMNMIANHQRTATYVCPECGSEHQHGWTLPLFHPGTDTLTTNGEHIVRLHSVLHKTPKEKVHRLLDTRRKQPSID